MEKLKALIEKLAAGGVEFVVVGGYAAVAHGASLLTRDVDICCRFSVENLRRLVRTLDEFHPKHRMTPQKLPLELTDEFAARLKNLYLDTDLGVLDCLSEVLGVGDFDEVLRQSIEINTPSGKCRVLSRDALIRAKETMGRTQDKLAVIQLKAIQERLLADAAPRDR
ncbi:MAG: nucleotidyltransferase [Verrucomicrobiota bacterium]|jgi:hypothetical protein